MRPPSGSADTGPAGVGVRPFDEVVALRAERAVPVRAVLDGLADERLTEVRTAPAGPGGGKEPYTVRGLARLGSG